MTEPFMVVENVTHAMWVCVRVWAVGGYIHTAVGEGKRVCVAGHALLLTVVGAGSRSHSVADVDVVRVDGLPARRMSGKRTRNRK